MKLLKVRAVNFGSYKEVEFGFNDQGLTLVHGATGSGKSTLQDLPVWALFGQTAKDGNADDVRSWTSEEATEATLELELGDSIIHVVRIRGTSAQNDLYWYEWGPDSKADPIRGKDITETQKLLNERLGIDPFLYTVGAYYNEFSPTGSFFTAKASDRRQLFESLANLELPTLLAERIADVKRETKKTITEVLERINKSEGRLDQLKRSQVAVERDAAKWEEKQTSRIIELKVKGKNFEQEKQSKIDAAQLKADMFETQRVVTIEKHLKDRDKQISKLLADAACAKCGVLRSKDEVAIAELHHDFNSIIEETANDDNPWLTVLVDLKNIENHYAEQIEAETLKVNPHMSQKDSINCDIQELESHKKKLKDQADSLNTRKNNLDQLHKINEKLRGELLKNSVSAIEHDTNRYLEKYFDAEIRVKFEMDKDKLDVLVWKSGNEASYRQLSKGQRGLLKLAFSVASMKAAANKSGVHFDTIMFDEALDGMDESLKLKAFNLFSELSLTHSTVLVIDHSEALQSMFDKRYSVTIDSDISRINES